MRELRKFVLRTVFTVFSIMAMAAMFASCSSHGGSSDGGGAIYSGGGSSGSGNGSSPSSAGGGTTRAVYTSYDSQGGYINVDSGQYRTCTLAGNSNGGTITLSDGSKDDLTGIYGTPDTTAGRAAIALSAAESGEVIIEGCWTVTFTGVNGSFSFSLFANKDLIAIRCAGSSVGAEFLFTAGAAVDTESVSSVTGGIAPGSADDPFARTWWSATPIDGTAQYSFHDGGTYSFNSHCGPYTVSRTSDGYKLCYLFSERNSSGSISSGTYNNWMLVYQSLTISDAGATEASCCSEGVWSYAGTGTVYNGNGQMSYDMPYKFYKVNP